MVWINERGATVASWSTPTSTTPTGAPRDGVPSSGESVVAAIIPHSAGGKTDGILLSIWGACAAVTLVIVNAIAVGAVAAIPLVSARTAAVGPNAANRHRVVGAFVVGGTGSTTDRVVFISVVAVSAVLKGIVLDGTNCAVGRLVPLIAATAIASDLCVSNHRNGTPRAVGSHGTTEVALWKLSFVTWSASVAVIGDVEIHRAYRAIGPTPAVAAGAAAIGEQSGDIGGVETAIDRVGADPIASWVVDVAVGAGSAILRDVVLNFAHATVRGAPAVSARAGTPRVVVTGNSGRMVRAVVLTSASPVAAWILLAPSYARAAVLGAVVDSGTIFALIPTPHVSAGASTIRN